MGDKERSTEAEQGREMKMVLHCPPMYPLPEEIKKMDHSETVCRYCGVSYLIYHEFHQLHTRLAQMEVELQELRETARRERAQREALELGRLEWERVLTLEVQREAEEKERGAREELEERNGNAERVLREELEEQNERRRRAMEEEYQKMSEAKVKQLRRELGDSEAERLRTQREELEKRSEEREKVLRDALQKASENLDELRKYLRQLEERLAAAASTKEEAEWLLGKERQRGEILRGVCARQEKCLRATLAQLRSTGGELTDVRGFLRQLTGAWQAFRSQMLQHSTQVFTALREELKHSTAELQKMGEDKAHLAQQLMEQRKQSEEQLSRQQDSEREHGGKLLRLTGELEEKHDRWLSCQRRCDAMLEQLSSWQRKDEEMTRRYSATEEEVARLRAALEKVQLETRELRRERDILIESHGRALTKMEEDCRQQTASKLAAALEEQRTQSALHLREQKETFRREVELELTIDREKNQLLLQQYRQDNTQFHQKLEKREQALRGLREELQQERRSREEERRTQYEQRRRREEEIHLELQRCRQQEALQLSDAKAELHRMTERNAELQEEVALLQETVRRECEEREGLTAALSKAQEELLGQCSPASDQGSSTSPPHATDSHAPSGNKHFHLHSQGRVPLTRSSTSPNNLRPFPACADKDKGRGTDGGGARRSRGSWNGGWVLGGEKRREGTLPRLKAISTVGDGKRKVS